MLGYFTETVNGVQGYMLQLTRQLIGEVVISLAPAGKSLLNGGNHARNRNAEPEGQVLA